MAIKAGQILHDVNGFVIDRIQTGGVSNLNIPQEKIYELGNYQTVATIRDIPDLSFEVQSLDTSTEMEAIVIGQDPTSIATGAALDFAGSMPIDVISPFKAAGGAFNIVKGIVVPYLTLEQVAYKYGTKSNAEETFTLRGDSIYYVPGTPKITTISLADNVLTYNLGGTALLYTEAGLSNYVLSACVKNPATRTYKRLFFGTDFTNTTTAITLLADWFDSGYTKLHVTWGTATAGTYAQTVHATTATVPAAVRGKDIDVYVTDPGLATPALARWPGVQSVDVSRRVNLSTDEEFGNYKNVSQDYDTADVTGSIVVKPADDAALYTLLRQVANVSSTSAILGPYSSTTLPIEIRINNPDTGVRMKTLYVSDARFTIPNIRGQVQQKATVTFNFTSDGGNLVVYKGAKP